MKRKHDKKSIVMSSERATINPRLSKYYDGYNVDTLMEKWYQGKQLNPEEHEIFRNVVDAYYEPELQKDCSQGYIRLLKIHDKGIYPTDSAIGTPYWKSIVGKKKPNADDALTDDDLRKELEALEADVEEMSKRDPLLPRYYKGYDMV